MLIIVWPIIVIAYIFLIRLIALPLLALRLLLLRPPPLLVICKRLLTSARLEISRPRIVVSDILELLLRESVEATRGVIGHLLLAQMTTDKVRDSLRALSYFPRCKTVVLSEAPLAVAHGGQPWKRSISAPGRLTVLKVLVRYPRVITLYVLHSAALHNRRTGERNVSPISYGPMKGVSYPRLSLCCDSKYIHVLAVENHPPTPS